MADEKTFISQLNSADTANDTDIMIIEGEETKKISFLALFNAIKKKISASLVFYDNSTSGLKAEDVQGAIDEVETKIDNTGLVDNLLNQHSIGFNMTFEELVSRNHVTYFTNWHDTTNFPSVYGSGVLIPQLDANGKYILYIAGNSICIGQYTKNNGIVWNDLGNKISTQVTASCGDNVLTFYFEKIGKLVTCRVGGVMSLESANKTYVFNNGGAVIPEGYKPSVIQYAILNLVVGEIIDGGARFAFNPDGTVAFISTKTDAREYNTTITWMTN